MSRVLHIASDLDLPLDAVTQPFAILAQRGAGKTYLALVMAEEEIKAGLHTVIVDPVGVCWGLRASSDGEREGLPILVLGGEHGDLPLSPEAGAVIADFVVDDRVSVILDLSHFRRAEQRRFVADFAEQLYLRNREPLHLFLDEADLFAPQQASQASARVLEAIEDIVRRGRARGLGVSLITQRSAVLNKDVLSQVGVLIALRTVSPQDIEAIDAWVKRHGTPEQRALLVDSLPRLATGTAWVWSPEWLNIFQQVHIRPRETFDSSATPTVGEQPRTPKRLAEIDLASLRERITSLLETPSSANAHVLRKQIEAMRAELTRARQEKGGQAREPLRVVVERVEIPVFAQGEVERLEQAARALETAGAPILAVLHEIRERLPGVVAQVQAVQQQLTALEADRGDGRKSGEDRAGASPVTGGRRALAEASTTLPAQNGLDLRQGERTLLETLARHYPLKLTRTQLATLSGYTASGGTFGSYYAALKRNGLLGEPAPAEVLITPAGFAYLGRTIPRTPLTAAEVQQMWRGVLGEGERRLFDALLEAFPEALTREELGRRANYAPGGGTFSSHLATLKRNDLVEVHPNAIRASETLFRDGES